MDEWNSYRFEMTWGLSKWWQNDFFGWTIPLINIQSFSFSFPTLQAVSFSSSSDNNMSVRMNEWWDFSPRAVKGAGNGRESDTQPAISTRHTGNTRDKTEHAASRQPCFTDNTDAALHVKRLFGSVCNYTYSPSRQVWIGNMSPRVWEAQDL